MVPPECMQCQGVPLASQKKRFQYAFNEINRLQGNAFAMACPLAVKIAQHSVDWHAVIEEYGNPV